MSENDFDAYWEASAYHDVTRVTVVIYGEHEVHQRQWLGAEDVKVSVQDNGRTLKVLFDHKPEAFVWDWQR